MKGGAAAVLAALVALAGCADEPAAAEAPTANWFAAAMGGRVVGVQRIGMPERLVDGDEREATGTSFGEASRLHARVSVDLETARVVTATAFRLRAANDQQEFVFRRALNGFRLDADRDGDGTFESLVFERSIPVDYARVPGNALANEPGELDLTVRFGAVTARRWRFTAMQGVDQGSIFDGPRLREIELHARP